jgi:gliding motility-associated-like protein
MKIKFLRIFVLSVFLLSVFELKAKDNENDCLTPAPTGQATQTFCIFTTNPTLAELVIVGEVGAVFHFYLEPSGGIEIPSNTPLQDDVTYYVSQEAGDPFCESLTRLAITVKNDMTGVIDYASAIRILRNGDISDEVIYNTTGSNADCINTTCATTLESVVDLGSFDPSSGQLRITGAEIKTAKTVGNVCSASVSYRVYKVGDTPGAFIESDLDQTAECVDTDIDVDTDPDTYDDGFGPCLINDRKYKNYGLNIDLTQGICVGNYILEVFYSYRGSGCTADINDCSGIKRIDNNGAFFTSTFSINDLPPPTILSVTHPTCLIENGDVEVGDLPETTWVLTESENGTSISNILEPIAEQSTIFANLPSGSYTFTYLDVLKNCTSLPSDPPVQINVKPVRPDAPIIDGITQTTCSSALGSVDFSGLPAGEWIITESLTNTTITGNTESATFSDLPAGIYTFTVTNDEPCTSPATAQVTINNQPQTPNAPTIVETNQTTCASAVGSVELGNLPAGDWTITESLTNTTITGNTATATFSDLPEGTYSFTVTNDEPCTSDATAQITINPQPQTPDAPIIDGITQTTCSSALGSVDFSGLPAGDWIITESLTNTTITGNTESATFGDLPPGIYTFIVTNDEPCTSPATAQITINSQPQTPNAPTIVETNQTTCASSVGSVELGNLPAGDWTITESLTNTTITGNTATATFSDLPEGIYSFTVTNDESCTSDATTQITINPQPQTPATPIIDGTTQTTCFSALGSVDFSGLPAGDWIITESLTNTTITGNTATATFIDLPPGIYTFTVTNDEPCTSPATAQITINTQPQTPNAPTIVATNQTTCTSALGSVEFSGLPAGSWIITETLSNTTITGNTTTASFTNLVVGTYSFFVTNNDGCTSPTTGNISINPQPQTPPAPTGNSPQIFCAEENATVADLEVNGNAIIWYTAAIGGIVIEPTVLLVNNGNYFASQTVGGCESTNRLAVLSQINSVVIDTISTKTPTCGLSDGFIEVLASGGDAPYTYTWNTGQSGELINSINNGTYTVTVIDMNSCVSNLSLSLSCEFSEIPEIITPNGNGENETWVIGLSEAFPQMEVKIYNRWGNEVFSASPYLDDWDGKANVGFKVGDEYLPSGTYFYVIDLKNGEKPKSGYIELVK